MFRPVGFAYHLYLTHWHVLGPEHENLDPTLFVKNIVLIPVSVWTTLPIFRLIP